GGGARPPVAEVEAAVESALACIGRDLEKDRIAVTIDVPRGTLAAIRPVSLRHIVVNVVLNARNALLPRGGTLTIRARRCERVPAGLGDAVVAPAIGGEDLWPAVSGESAVGGTERQDQGCIVLTIEETGCGIEPERLANIFEPYRSSYREHPN